MDSEQLEESLCSQLLLDSFWTKAVEMVIGNSK